jgi:hypothetical protein
VQFGADLGNGLRWAIPNVASFGLYLTAHEVHVVSFLLSKGRYVGSYSWNDGTLLRLKNEASWDVHLVYTRKYNTDVSKNSCLVTSQPGITRRVVVLEGLFGPKHEGTTSGRWQLFTSRHVKTSHKT